jgi:2-polyprenyl-6-hydroxyphenyl methylase/3-demethylubiquinone-9 3-methyltransferase
MPVDNSIYEAPGDIWWDETQPLSALRTAINPGRMAYLAEVLKQEGMTGRGSRALDIGCGGGLMAEEVARMGFAVSGVDPAAASVAVARAHALTSDLDIEYATAGGESLPFPDQSFDLVYCCDVLEHVTDPGQVIRETSRVLRPGGLFFYDTINRTRASKLLMIKMFQDWSLTAWMPRDLHAWGRLHHAWRDREPAARRPPEPARHDRAAAVRGASQDAPRPDPASQGSADLRRVRQAERVQENGRYRHPLRRVRREVEHRYGSVALARWFSAPAR